MIVDTSVWIDFLNACESPQTGVLVRAIEEDEHVCLTGLIVTEILQGIRNPRRFALIRDDLLQFPILDASLPDTYLRAADLYRRARRRGLTVRSTVDCVIAAIAIESDHPVLHRDRDYALLRQISPLKEVPV